MLQTLSRLLITIGICGFCVTLLWRFHRWLFGDGENQDEETSNGYRCLVKTETPEGLILDLWNLKTERMETLKFRREHMDWNRLCEIEPNHIIRLHFRPYTAYQDGKSFRDVMIRLHD